MRVLKQGNPAKIKWSREFKCSGRRSDGDGCGASLLVEFNDLYKTYRTVDAYETDTFITFMCPQCGTETSPDWTELGRIRWYLSDIPNSRPQRLTDLKEKLIKGEKKNG